MEMYSKRDTEKDGSSPAGKGIPWGLISRMGIPGSLASTIAWLGTLTFVNLYITRKLGYPTAMWTSLSLGFIGANIAGNFLAGGLAPLLGLRRTIALCHECIAFSYVLFAFSKNPIMLVIGLIICGFAAGVCATTGTSMLLGAISTRPGRAVSASVVIGGTIGIILAVACGQWIKACGYATTFILCAVISALSGILFLLMTHPVRLQVAGPPERSLLEFIHKEWRYLLRPQILFLLAFGALLEPFVFHTSNQLTANLFDTVFGADEAYIGNVIGFSRLFNIAGAFTVGMLFEWIKPQRRWGLGLILSGLSVVAMGYTRSGCVAVAAYVFYQFFYVLNWCGNSVSIVEAMGKNRRTAALSILMGVMQIGAFLAGIAHRVLIGAGLTLSTVFMICGSIGMLGGLALVCRQTSGKPPLSQSGSGRIYAV